MKVSNVTINGEQFSQMIRFGAHHLANQADMIDSLNVFPVPDGDTGTNMNLTMTSGAKEVEQASTNHVGDIGQAFAKGLLMGARGNSGVILSQLFRGFSKSIKDKEALTVTDLSEALLEGVNTAYKAVMKPVEGTILTVAKDAAIAGEKAVDQVDNVVDWFEIVLKEAKQSLERTPDLLPVLKEVGVVDSGGQGLVVVYEGFIAALKGEEIPESSGVAPSLNDLVNAEHHKMHQDFMDTSEIEFGYCTEFMVKFEEDKLKENPFDEEKYREELSHYGDSLLVVSDDEVVKVHIHAEYPGDVMTIGQKYGSLINIKIENMREQHQAIVGDKKEAKKDKKPERLNMAVVTVAMGEGIKTMFESIGVNVVVEGGQTMNPSTKDIASAIEEANADQVIVLPNNKNIIMAAEQAEELVDSDVVVVPTKTVPQGIAAMLQYNPEASLKDNFNEMSEAIQYVKTGQITYAVRDTQINGKTIEKGNFMGIKEGDIESINPNKMDAITELLKELIDEDEDEIITIIQGEEGTDEEVELIRQFIEEHYDELEIEILNGEQPIYSFIFSVE